MGIGRISSMPGTLASCIAATFLSSLGPLCDDNYDYVNWGLRLTDILREGRKTSRGSHR